MDKLQIMLKQLVINLQNIDYLGPVWEPFSDSLSEFRKWILEILHFLKPFPN